MIPDVLRLLHNHSRSGLSDDYSDETSELTFPSDSKSVTKTPSPGIDYPDYDLDSNWASKTGSKGFCVLHFTASHL